MPELLEYEPGMKFEGDRVYYEDSEALVTKVQIPLGLPPDPTQKYLPGLESVAWYDSSTFNISSIGQDLWDSFSQFSESAYSGTKQVLKKGYNDLKEGVGTVVGDVTEPISDSLKTTFWYAILAVGALGAVIYFAGKSGALRISR